MKADVNDTLRNEGVDAVRARHDRAKTYHRDIGLGVWNAGDDIEPPPPRGWLLGNTFCRCFNSSLIAEGGTGKTALRYLQALALATGRALTGEHVFQRSRVLIVSLEDDDKELRRRILAARLHYNIPLSELDGWLFLAAPGARAGRLKTVNEKGQIVDGQLKASLEAAIEAYRTDLVLLDPFVKSHSIEENSNTGIDDVVQLRTDLAAKYDIAIDAPHHNTKGKSDPGNADRGRGASAMKDAARLVSTLTPMSPEEAKAFGIPEHERRQYIRLDRAKTNIVRMSGPATWFKLVGIRLGNATALYPNGDEVQTVEPWSPPETWAGLDDNLLNRILTEIEAGLPDKSRYSAEPRAAERAAWRVVRKFAPDKTEAQAREIIKTWVASGLLVEIEYRNIADRKDRKGLRVDPTKRPGTCAIG